MRCLPTAGPLRATASFLLSALVATSVTTSAQGPGPNGAAGQGRPTAPAPAPARPTTPTTQTPAPTPAPANPAPVVRRPAAPAPPARGGLTVIVTDMAGGPLRDIRVQAVGPTERSGTTDGSGQLRITGVQSGTYRLRFTSDAIVEFEREVVVRGGPNTEVDVSLRPAPPPVVVTAPAPPPVAPPVAPPAPIGPIGQPLTVSIADLVTKAFLDGPRKELLLSCSANARTTLVQLSVDQPDRLYENAEVTYHVIGGEGAVRIGTMETPLKLDSFVSIPRGLRFSVTRKGRRPLIMVMQLSGEPCEQAK